jgi:hypothetical protein
MDKAQASQQMNRLRAEMEKLQAILDAPDTPSALLPITIEDRKTYCLGTDGRGLLNVSAVGVGHKVSSPAEFVNKETASAYADAFNTLLELRQQPGTIGLRYATDEEPVFSIDWTPNLAHILWVNAHTSRQTFAKYSGLITPLFCSTELARAAIQKVGSEVIVRMLKTLTHYAG